MKLAQHAITGRSAFRRRADNEAGRQQEGDPEHQPRHAVLRRKHHPRNQSDFGNRQEAEWKLHHPQHRQGPDQRHCANPDHEAKHSAHGPGRPVEQEKRNGGYRECGADQQHGAECLIRPGVGAPYAPRRRLQVSLRPEIGRAAVGFQRERRHEIDRRHGHAERESAADPGEKRRRATCIGERIGCEEEKRCKERERQMAHYQRGIGESGPARSARPAEDDLSYAPQDKRQRRRRDELGDRSAEIEIEQMIGRDHEQQRAGERPLRLILEP